MFLDYHAILFVYMLRRAALQIVLSLGDNMLNLMVQIFEDEDGASAIEYGLLASLVCLAIMVALAALGDPGLTTIFNKLAMAIGGAPTACSTSGLAPLAVSWLLVVPLIVARRRR